MKKLNELDAMASSASDIIHDLMSFIELVESPDMEQRLKIANMWLEWNAGDLRPKEAQEVCKQLTGCEFIPLENTITIEKDLWNSVLHNMENLHDIAEECLENYTTNNRISEVNDMWVELENLGLYNKN